MPIPEKYGLDHEQAKKLENMANNLIGKEGQGIGIIGQIKRELGLCSFDKDTIHQRLAVVKRGCYTYGGGGEKALMPLVEASVRLQENMCEIFINADKSRAPLFIDYLEEAFQERGESKNFQFISANFIENSQKFSQYDGTFGPKGASASEHSFFGKPIDAMKALGERLYELQQEGIKARREERYGKKSDETPDSDNDDKGAKP